MAAKSSMRCAVKVGIERPHPMDFELTLASEPHTPDRPGETRVSLGARPVKHALFISGYARRFSLSWMS